MALDIPKFRVWFPEITEALYDDATVTAVYSQALIWIDEQGIAINGFRFFSDDGRQYAIHLLVAHILIVNDNAKSGTVSHAISSMNAGGVSLSTLTSYTTDFSTWLQSTPRGTQLNSFLKKASFGVYVGGSALAVFK